MFYQRPRDTTGSDNRTCDPFSMIAVLLYVDSILSKWHSEETRADVQYHVTVDHRGEGDAVKMN